MRRVSAVLAWLVVTIVGCKVGPKYEPEPVIPPTQRIGAVPSSDSTRQFFDSLAVERTRDSVPVIPPNAARATINTAAAGYYLRVLRAPKRPRRPPERPERRPERNQRSPRSRRLSHGGRRCRRIRADAESLDGHETLRAAPGLGT